MCSMFCARTSLISLIAHIIGFAITTVGVIIGNVIIFVIAITAIIIVIDICIVIASVVGIDIVIAPSLSSPSSASSPPSRVRRTDLFCAIRACVPARTLRFAQQLRWVTAVVAQ